MRYLLIHHFHVAALCADSRLFEGSWDGFRLLAFYVSIFSRFDIFSDMTFDLAEVMLTLFSLGIFYLCTVLLEHCSLTKTQPNKCNEK